MTVGVLLTIDKLVIYILNEFYLNHELIKSNERIMSVIVVQGTVVEQLQEQSQNEGSTMGIEILYAYRIA